MEKVFSDKTEEGIRLIWMQFDPEKTAEGVRLLREAADAGDPDALCFLARTYMGERYVWEYAALEINGEKAASLLKEGIRRGSACAVLLAMRCGELTPSARIPRLPMETLSTLFFQLRLDHPEIFYAVGFSCRAVPEAAFVEFWPEYRFEKKRIRELRKEQEQQEKK